MDITQQWGAYMAFRGNAARTVESRTRALRRLAKLHGDLLTLGPVDIVTYLATFPKASTRATNLSYIRCFYAWCVEQDLLTDDPTRKVPKVKVPNGVPRPAPRDDVSALLRTASPRTRCMALLMVYAGMRCCEVAAFRHEHLTQSADGGWWVDIPHSKGGHHQQVPLPADIAAEVLAGPSWAVTVQTVQKDVRDGFRAIGSSATPHQLRHYYGTAALQSTQNLARVQQMMRHASPATTARYTLVASSDLSNAAEGLPRIA